MKREIENIWFSFREFLDPILRWFSIWWYKYLFEKKNWQQKCYEISWFTIIFCRFRNHPYDVWWYNPSGLEPNMHCKNCEDDLG